MMPKLLTICLGRLFILQGPGKKAIVAVAQLCEFVSLVLVSAGLDCTGGEYCVGSLVWDTPYLSGHDGWSRDVGSQSGPDRI